jgi:hypothetical protein
MLWDMNFVQNVLIYRLLVKVQVKLMKEFLIARIALVMNMLYILMGDATIVIGVIVRNVTFKKIQRIRFVIDAIMIII